MFGPKTFVRRLKRLNIEYVELLWENGGAVYVVPRLGGRILGVFPDKENLLWVNPRPTKGWNAGGQRTWYAPEGGDAGIYFSEEGDKWSVPPSMDPGDYRVVERMGKNLVGVENNFSVYSNEGCEYDLTFTRRIWVDEKKEPWLSPDLKSICLSFEHRMKNRMERTIGNEIGLCSVLQVAMPGTVVVPVTDSGGKLFDDSYYEPFPQERMKRGPKTVSILADATDRRYKLGFSPKTTAGRIGYISQLTKRKWYAVVKLFSMDPEGKYVDKPREFVRENGDAVLVYNHSGKGKTTFAELQCHAPAPFLAPGEEQVFPVSLVFLQGKKEAVSEAFSKLMDEPELKVF
jgi:hypothetical protein